MATASDNPSDSIRVMEEDLSCNICYNLLREPKDLDCPHVYCLQCLQQWTKKKPSIECPECRHVTFVPQGGLAKLKTNLRLKNMVESYLKVASVKSAEKQISAPLCPYHVGEQQHFFCVTCSITVCHNCLVLKHPQPQHEIKELNEVNKAEEGKSTREKQELDDIEKKLKAAKEQAERHVKARVQQITATAETHGREMIQCIQTTYQQRMEILKEKQIRLGTSRLPTTTRNIHTAADSRSVISRIDNLSIHQDDTLPHDMTTLHFNPGPPSFLFGEVVSSTNRELKLTHTTDFGSFENAQSVAASHAGLVAVVDYKAKETSIHYSVKGEYKCGFRLVVSKPLSVAISSQGKFFVSDKGVVKVFSLEGRYEKSWPKSVVATKITTTPDDMVVICIICSMSIGVIAVHHANGELIRTHQADCGNIANIASNGKHIAFTTGSRGKVCAIDFVTGQTLWTLTVTWAGGVCYEQKSNTLLMALGNSNIRGQVVIEQYCSTTGSLISRLASGLYNPCAMTVTHDNKLVVADIKTVKVYSIQ